MKILLIYFTGTYNTRFITKMIQDEFKNNHQVDCIEMDSSLVPLKVVGYDLIGLGYPIYGFNSPKIFNTLLRRFTFEPNQKYFIYKNSGETFALNNASSRIIIRRMKRIHLHLIGEFHFVMPYNIHFRYEEDFVKQILEMNKKILKIMSYGLLNNKVYKIKSNVLYNFVAFLVSIQKIGGEVNSFFYRVDKKKCIKCGLCAKDCPTKNIEFKDGNIKFKHHCQMCMRCSFYCPTNSIKIGFLEKWKVNGKYDFISIASNDKLKGEYLKSNNKKFYSCFKKTFKMIEKEYRRIIGSE